MKNSILNEACMIPTEWKYTRWQTLQCTPFYLLPYPPYMISTLWMSAKKFPNIETEEIHTNFLKRMELLIHFKHFFRDPIYANASCKCIKVVQRCKRRSSLTTNEIWGLKVYRNGFRDFRNVQWSLTRRSLPKLTKTAGNFHQFYLHVEMSTLFKIIFWRRRQKTETRIVQLNFENEHLKVREDMISSGWF